MAELADEEAIEGGEDKGAELAALFLGAGEEILLKDFAVEEILEDIFSALLVEVLAEDQVGFEGGQVAFDQLSEGLALALGVDVGSAINQGPVGGVERCPLVFAHDLNCIKTTT